MTEKIKCKYGQDQTTPLEIHYNVSLKDNCMCVHVHSGYVYMTFCILSTLCPLTDAAHKMYSTVMLLLRYFFSCSNKYYLYYPEKVDDLPKKDELVIARLSQYYNGKYCTGMASCLFMSMSKPSCNFFENRRGN